MTALNAVSNLLEAANVLIEKHGFTPARVNELLTDVLGQIDAKPWVVPSSDELNSAA